MSGRARLLELRESRETARRGREVLEQKLELLRTELLRRMASRDLQRAALEHELLPARAALESARIELGRRAVDSAALAQATDPPIAKTAARIAGVELPRFAWSAPFQRRYGPGGTSASLDDAAARFCALLPAVAALAGEEAAVRHLRVGMQRTARRLNALEKAVLPALESELRELGASLAEEERDESFRRKLWIESHAA